MSEPTILRRDHGRVAVLTINRPHVRNAIDMATIRLLGDEVHALGRDDAVRVLVLTGSGEVAFSSGGDMTEMVTFSPLSADTLMEAWQETLARVER